MESFAIFLVKKLNFKKQKLRMNPLYSKIIMCLKWCIEFALVWFLLHSMNFLINFFRYYISKYKKRSFLFLF